MTGKFTVCLIALRRIVLYVHSSTYSSISNNSRETVSRKRIPLDLFFIYRYPWSKQIKHHCLATTIPDSNTMPHPRCKKHTAGRHTHQYQRHLISLLQLCGLFFLVSLCRSAIKPLNESGSRLQATSGANTSSLEATSGANSSPLARMLPGEMACQYLNESIPLLTLELRDNAEKAALRPWSTMAANKSFSFPPLDNDLLMNVFRRRRVVFLGDSTLYYMTKWLKVLLEKTSPATLNTLASMNMTKANSLVNPKRDNHLGFPGDPPPIIDSEGTHIAWRGYSGGNSNESCSFQKYWVEMSTTIRPEILVVNFGLHWLQQYHGGRNLRGCVVRRWVDYAAWLDEVVWNAERMGVKVLLFKTTNLMCTSKFRGLYDTVNKLYEAGGSEILRRCQDSVRQAVRSDNENISEEDMALYCRKGAFNEAGSSYLNERLYKYVESANAKKESTSSNQNRSTMIIDVYNDHDVESCAYTNDMDGRHYHPLNLLRIRLLANTLQCHLQQHAQDHTIVTR